MQGHQQRARAGLIAVFAEVKPLPGAQLQPPGGHWQRYLAPQQAGFYMGRHIIGAFIGMFVIWRMLRCQLVKMGFHIAPHRTVSIFIDAREAEVCCRKK